jgi:hypothetical protein
MPQEFLLSCHEDVGQRKIGERMEGSRERKARGVLLEKIVRRREKNAGTLSQSIVTGPQSSSREPQSSIRSLVPVNKVEKLEGVGIGYSPPTGLSTYVGKDGWIHLQLN